MYLDYETLEAFHDLACDAGENAADRLSQMVGEETELATAKIKFVSAINLESEFDFTSDHFAMITDLGGDLHGHSIVIFDDSTEAEMRHDFLPVLNSGDAATPESISDQTDDDNLERSGVIEFAHILGCAWVDIWADILEMVIDVSPPRYYAAPTGWLITNDLTHIGGITEASLLFKTEITSPQTDARFIHYFIPAIEELEQGLHEPHLDADVTVDDLGWDENEQNLPAIDDDEPIDDFDTDFSDADSSTDHNLDELDALDVIRAVAADHRLSPEQFHDEKIAAFESLVEQGGTQAVDAIDHATDQHVALADHNMMFVDLDDLAADLSDNSGYGVVFRYDGLPSGYLIVSFPHETATRIVDDMAYANLGDTTQAEVRESALSHLGETMASNILDGWANVIDMQVDRSPPTYREASEAELLAPVIDQLGKTQDYAFVFDHHIDVNGHPCSVYTICEVGSLGQALHEID